MTAIAGKGQKVLVVAVFTFHSDKSVMQIAAIEIPVNDLLQMKPPESVLPGEMIIIDPNECFKIVLYAAVVIRTLRVSWAINSGRKRHDLSSENIMPPLFRTGVLFAKKNRNGF